MAKRVSQGSHSSGGTNKSVGGVASTPYKTVHTGGLPNKSRAKRGK